MRLDATCQGYFAAISRGLELDASGGEVGAKGLGVTGVTGESSVLEVYGVGSLGLTV